VNVGTYLVDENLMDNQNTATGNPLSDQPLPGAGSPPLPPLNPIEETPVYPAPPTLTPTPELPVVPSTSTPQVTISTSAPIENIKVETQPPASETIPPTFSPIGSSTTTTTETVTTEPKSEGEEPKLKPKKRVAPAIMAALALFLVAGIAGASYYVSTQLSQRTAVAPTAPESEPFAAGCDTGVRDTPTSNSITFSRAGTVRYFTRNTAGAITLTGPKTVTLNPINGNPVQQSQTFDVAAGETYTIKVRLSNESRDAAGWIPNKSTNICGPTKSSACGADADISALRNLAAANSDITGITAGGAAANIQCWGDAVLGDSTQDYDYNDFSIIFGYAAAARQNWCSSASINKTTVRPGESVTLSSTANTQVNSFWYAAYNRENLYPAGDPKPICVGNDPILPECSQLDQNGNPRCACPTGGHHLILFDPNKTTMRPSGSVTTTYEALNLFDVRAGAQIKTIQWNAYFSIGSGPWSFPEAACVTYMSLAAQVTPRTCRQTCSASQPCAAGLSCTGGVCRNSSCTTTDNTSCVCPTPPRTCRQTCSASQPCAAGLTCIADEGICRNSTCPSTDNTSCVCPPPPTPKTCRQTCSVTDPGNDCAAGLSCVGGICRNSSCTTTDNTSCVCPTPVAPACTQVQVAVLRSGAWTKIPNTEISASVKVGDTIRLYGRGNAVSTRMRFKAVKPDGLSAFTPEWKDGVLETSSGTVEKNYYVELPIGAAGSYSFEAQVL